MFFDFKTLDIVKNPLEQDFTEKSIDVVVAVNVLHATNNALQSLKNIHKILKPDGVVLLAEISPPENSIYRYMELTFGILPSYFNYQDKDLRPFTPIIRPEQWCNILKVANFRQTDTLPSGKVDMDDRGGIVLGYK